MCGKVACVSVNLTRISQSGRQSQNSQGGSFNINLPKILSHPHLVFSVAWDGTEHSRLHTKFT